MKTTTSESETAPAVDLHRVDMPLGQEPSVNEASDAVGGGGVGGASVLDACCGSRMFWFDRKDPRTLFVDKRRERHMVADCSVKNGEREIVVDPDMLADFTALPFPDCSFAHVVFDPPHIQRSGDSSWLLKKYGVLRGEWREMLRQGFTECFRVLRPEGTLIFKWNEIEVPLREILALTPERPLYGHRTGKQAKTHWVAFLKGGRGAEQATTKLPKPMSEEAIQKGVAEAMDFWLSQHDVSTPACIEAAIEKAFAAWLEAHAEEIVERIAAKSPTEKLSE